MKGKLSDDVLTSFADCIQITVRFTAGFIAGRTVDEPLL